MQFGIWQEPKSVEAQITLENGHILQFTEKRDQMKNTLWMIIIMTATTTLPVSPSYE